MDRSPGDPTQCRFHRGCFISFPADWQRTHCADWLLVRVHDRGALDAGRNPEGKAKGR